MSDIEALFRRYRERVYRWAFGMCGQHADASDVCQEVFMRALIRQPRLENETASLGWLRRVTTTIAIDRWRSRRGSRVRHGAEIAAGVEERADEHAAVQESAEQIRRALDRLSEQQRLVLVAKEFDDRTFSQIAEELGITVSTVKTHYVRALEALRRELGVKSGVASPPRRIPV